LTVSHVPTYLITLTCIFAGTQEIDNKKIMKYVPARCIFCWETPAWPNFMKSGTKGAIATFSNLAFHPSAVVMRSRKCYTDYRQIIPLTTIFISCTASCRAVRVWQCMRPHWNTSCFATDSSVTSRQTHTLENKTQKLQMIS